MDKLCKTCGLLKPYDPQAPSPKATGFMGRVCWTCFLEASTKRRATPEGRAKHKAANAKIRATPEGRAKANAAGLAWAKHNPGKATANVVRRTTAKLQRTPAWANLHNIQQLYVQAQQLGLVVDHIYPLRGKLVSGLHVENNLQLLTKTENAAKGNKMPNIGEII